MRNLKIGTTLFASAALASSVSSGAEKPDDPQANGPIITVGKNSLWHEAEKVTTNYEMLCPFGQSIILKLEITPIRIDVLELAVSGTNVDQSLVDEIEEALNGLGGFDYPYAGCARDNVRITFDSRSENGELRSAGWILN